MRFNVGTHKCHELCGIDNRSPAARIEFGYAFFALIFYSVGREKARLGQSCFFSGFDVRILVKLAKILFS